VITFAAMSTTAPSVLRAPSTQASASARSVESVYKSTTFHWVGNGFFVSTYFPSDKLPAERVSPFVLMDYGPPKEFAPWPAASAASGGIRIAGFETVTLAWEGAVAHATTPGTPASSVPGTCSG
jgi:hypothetical protein